MTLVTGELKKSGQIAPTEMETILRLFEEQKKEIADLKQKQSGGGNSDIATIITQVVKAVREGDKQGITIRDGIQLGQIPTEDYDEKGTVFCAPSSGYVITDYFKMGHRILPPYGIDAIYFEHKASRRKREGKEHQIFYTCMYKSHSKELTAWLKQHPLFNIAFYESQRAMNSLDVRKAVRTAQLMNTLRDWDGIKIIKHCTAYNVEKHDDIDVMRNQLVTAILAKEEEEERKLVAVRMNESAKERLLTEDHKA